LLAVANKKLVHEKTILQDGKFSFGTILRNNEHDEQKKDDKNCLKSLLSLFDTDPATSSDSTDPFSNTSKMCDLSELLLNDGLLSLICNRHASNSDIFKTVCSSHSELQALISNLAFHDNQSESFPCTKLMSTVDILEWNDWFGLASDDNDIWFKHSAPQHAIGNGPLPSSVESESAQVGSTVHLAVSNQCLNGGCADEINEGKTEKLEGCCSSGETSVADTSESPEAYNERQIVTEAFEEQDEICIVCGSTTLEKSPVSHTEEVWGPLPSVLMYCDGCNETFHPECVKLDSVPEEDWFCKKCHSLRQKDQDDLLNITTSLSRIRKVNHLPFLTDDNQTLREVHKRSSHSFVADSNVAFVSLENFTKRKRIRTSSSYDNWDDENTHDVDEESPSIVCAFCYRKCHDLEELQVKSIACIIPSSTTSFNIIIHIIILILSHQHT
jgi:hypothetical protein